VCGISFIFNPQGLSPDEKKMLEGMMALQFHRGPDGQGIAWGKNWGLAHNRLAVLDQTHIQELNNGPWPDEDQQIVLSFNGEITNYQQIKKKLMEQGVKFTTTSDTEVLARAWNFYGPSIVASLSGMFAFVLWDQKRQKIFIARDRHGIKPLYQKRNGKSVFLSSEIKALKATGPLTLNPRAWQEFLIFGYASGPETLYQEVHSIPAGKLGALEVHGGAWEWTDFHNLSDQELQQSFNPPLLHAGSSNDDIQQLLMSTVTQHLSSDGGMALLLSGGLDSTFLAHVMAQQLGTKAFHSYSIVVEDDLNSELSYQEQVVQRLGLQHHSVKMGAKEFMANFEKAQGAMDAPVFHLGSVLLLELYRQVSATSKVAMTGEGADELFAGYPRHHMDEKLLHKRALQFSKETDLLPPAWKFLETYYYDLRRIAHSPMRLKKMLQENCWSDSIASSGELHAGLYRRLEALQPLSNQTVLQHDRHFHLEALLTRQDRMSSAVSVECRVPFSDPQLWWALQAVLSDEGQYQRWQNKLPLRQYLSEFYPDSFVNRKKKGLGLPLRQWLLKPPMRGLLDILFSNKAKQRGWYNYSQIEQEIRQFEVSDSTSAQYLFRLIQGEAWLQMVGL